MRTYTCGKLFELCRDQILVRSLTTVDGNSSATQIYVGARLGGGPLVMTSNNQLQLPGGGEGNYFTITSPAQLSWWLAVQEEETWGLKPFDLEKFLLERYAIKSGSNVREAQPQWPFLMVELARFLGLLEERQRHAGTPTASAICMLLCLRLEALVSQQVAKHNQVSGFQL